MAYARPVWKDLMVGEYNGSSHLQFDISNPELPLLNPVVQDGTRHNMASMNNLIFFYNFIAMRGTKYSITGLGTNLITEEFREIEADPETTEHRLIMRNITQKTNNGNTFIVREELYDLNIFNQNVLIQDRTITFNKLATGWEAIIP